VTNENQTPGIPDGQANGSGAWGAREDDELEQLEQATQTDAERASEKGSRPDRWRPLRREGHNEATERFQMAVSTGGCNELRELL
jgi:hypothetical protein